MNQYWMMYTVTGHIGDEQHSSIHIDESGFPKQGNDSVGVSRQYCGRLGKVDNCQVGVFLGYTSNNNRMLLDKRLYFPEERIVDKEHRKKCNREYSIPDQSTVGIGTDT